MRKYNSVTLKQNFIDLIDNAILQDPNYCTRVEFVRDAIREKLATMGAEK